VLAQLRRCDGTTPGDLTVRYRLYIWSKSPISGRPSITQSSAASQNVSLALTRQVISWTTRTATLEGSPPGADERDAVSHASTGS
jgi:hypothetical protein